MDSANGGIQSYDQFVAANGNKPWRQNDGFATTKYGSAYNGYNDPKADWTGSRIPAKDFQGSRTPAWGGGRSKSYISADLCTVIW